MKPTTWKYISDARRSFDWAQLKLNELRDASWQLHRPAQSEEQRFLVERLLLEWALHMRQMFVFIDKAAKVDGLTPEFRKWWKEIDADLRHGYFRWVRNGGFKNGEIVLSEEWLDDPELGQLGYFVLAGGPMNGDPFLARCQQYMDWAYNDVMCEAREQLFHRFREDMSAEFAARPGLF